MNLERIIELQKLLVAFNNLERTLLLPSVPGRMHRNETDTEHSYSLAMVAWYLASRLPKLNPDLCVRYALAHDLVELFAGDTFVYNKDDSVRHSKDKREHHALELLQKQWPDFPAMIETIAAYKAQHDEESRFIYALDKIMPMIINHLSEGINYRQHGIQLADVQREKAHKVAVSPDVTELYNQLIALFESKPEYFASSTQDGAEQDKSFLKQAVRLSEQSPEPVGCGVLIVARDGDILAAAHNSQRADNIAVHHAEIKAIIAANQKLGSRKLEHVTAYCSCEPCAMCLTALSYAKVPRIIFHKRMVDLFPDDPQSQLDCYSYVRGLNFTPILYHIPVLS